MKFKIAFSVLLIGFLFHVHAQSYKIKEEVKHIVFLGNSITYARRYITYIDAYLSIRYPQKNYEIINLGLPSETVSGLSKPNQIMPMENFLDPTSTIDWKSYWPKQNPTSYLLVMK